MARSHTASTYVSKEANLFDVGSLFGGASSEVRRCKCSVVVKARASFLPEIYLSISLSTVLTKPIE